MKRLTNSEMKSFRRCHRQWYLAYYRGLRKRGHDFNRPLGIGNRVHDALAAYYDPYRRLDPIAHINVTVQRDVTRFPGFAGEIEKEADLSRAMIDGYMQWVQETGADEGLRLISTEGAREVPLEPSSDLIGDVTLLAKLDARILREDDGARLALEHKTVGDLSMPLPSLQLDTQLLTEHLVEYMALLAEGRESEAAQGVLYNMLRKVKRTARAKPPFYRRETVQHNVHELRNHWKHVVAIATAIRTAELQLNAGTEHHFVAPPSPTRDCKWDCEFYGICPMFDDGSDVSAPLNDLYEVHDPLERYDGLSAAETNSYGVGLPA